MKKCPDRENNEGNNELVVVVFHPLSLVSLLHVDTLLSPQRYPRVHVYLCVDTRDCSVS